MFAHHTKGKIVSHPVSQTAYSFSELGDQEFDEFSRKHPLNNFVQSLDLALAQRARGLNVRLVGVKSQGSVVAAARLVLTRNRLGFHQAIAEKGPLLDYDNDQLLGFFTRELKSYLKKSGVHELVISPYLPYVERDAEGTAHPERGDHSWLVDRLASLGYQHGGFDMNFSNINWMFVKDLDGFASDEELIMSTGYRTRKAIRKSEKNGVYVVEASASTLQEFFDTVETAGEEKGFSNRPIEYYQNLLSSTRPGFTRLMMARINLSEFRGTITKTLKQERVDNAALRQEVEATGSKKKTAKLKVSDELIESYERSLAEVSGFTTAEDVLTLAAIYFACFGDEVVCVIGGSNPEYVYFNGATALYWHMMKVALEEGFSKYNFYGTFGIDGQDDAGHGGYEFKKGFGGKVVQLIGEFTIPVRPIPAKLFHFAQGLKSRLR